MKYHLPRGTKLPFFLVTSLFLIAFQLLSYCVAPAYAGSDAGNVQRKTVKVAAYNADEIFLINKDTGKKSGYAYEYIETIARYVGWDVDYVLYPGFLACIDAVKNGEADLAFDISYTDERAQFMSFPNEPMGKENYYLYFLDFNKSIVSDNLDTLQHKKIGVTRGTKQIGILREWLRKNHVDAEIVEYANSAERKDALWKGEVDLNLVANRYSKEHFIAFGSVGADDFYLTVNKARPDILNDLNDAHRLMMSINPYFITDISKRYFAYASICKSLSTQELDWLEQHPVIYVGCLSDDPPYSYRSTDTNEIKGAAVDTLNHILKVLYIDDIKLEFKMYESYEALLDALQNDEIDMIAQYYFNYDRAAQDNVIITTDIYDAQIGIVRKAGTSYNDAFTKLAYQKSRTDRGYAWNKYNEATFIPCDNLLDCLEEVHNGNATGVIGLGSTIAIYAQAYPDLEYTPMLETVPLCFAASKENVPLISMLDKGRGLINAGEIDAIMAGHQPMAPFSVYKFISSHIITSLVGVTAIITIILIVFFMTITNRRLKAQNKLIDDQNAAMKEYQVQLKKSLQDVKKADKAKTTFLFNMSHDIRTPMNAIIGFTNLLEKNIDNKELSLNYINKIQSSNEFLLSLINNVLEMARIESGKATLDETYIDLEKMIPEIAAVFEPQMKEKGLDFSYSLQVEHNHIMMDATKAREIILNIISNALKYTPAGGSVSCDVTEMSSTTPNQAVFKITIKDTGIGMPKEFVDTIYEAFTRERNTTQSGILGTGLGMHIVKKLVDLMGGRIHIESDLGKGTAITITMTHRIAPEHLRRHQASENVEIDTEKFKNMRILLAEDNALNAEIAQTLLEEQGFKVELARNGVECIDMLTTSQPGYYDLILMDVQMPLMDGYRAAISIRGMKHSSYADIPIIAMTANAFDEDKRNALWSGMNAHIPKPFNINLLFETIEMVMEHKHFFIRSDIMNEFKEKYKAMGLKCGQLIFRPDSTAEILYYDETTQNIVGCINNEEFMSYTKGTFINIIPSTELAKIDRQIGVIEESQAPQGTFDFNIIRRDGQIRQLKTIGCRAFNGKEIVCFVYLADITDIK